MDYTYSYSGADCDAYAYFDHDPKRRVYKLNSLATISISVHEAKSPVRRLGERGICGITSSIRTIAGSMIMLTIEDHPLGEMLSDQINYVQSWSRDQGRSKTGLSFRNLSTMLPEFNILLVYKTEITGNKKRKSFNHIGEENTSVLIKGVSLVNEGMVTSINDLVTEVSLQFISKDVQMIENSYKSEEYWMKNTLSKNGNTKRNDVSVSQKTVETGLITLKEASKAITKEQSSKISDDIDKKMEELKKAEEKVVEDIKAIEEDLMKPPSSLSIGELSAESIAKRAEMYVAARRTSVNIYNSSLSKKKEIHAPRISKGNKK